MMWLVDIDTMHAMRAHADVHGGPDPVAEREHAEGIEAREGDPSNLTRSGDSATIRVHGLLTPRPSRWAMLFGGGGTAYSSIRQAIVAVAADPRIRSVEFDINSPGGSVEGLFETLDLIRELRAEKTVTVSASQAQSAAYGIAAAAGQITATHRGATFGSVGVAAAYWMSSSVVTLTNTESPEKRPDLSTEEGRKVVVRHLDEIHGLFTEAIGAGRGRSAEHVADAYGRGASFLADAALGRGMIDAIATPVLRAVPKPAAVAETNGDTMSMDLRTLQAQHPDVYDAAVAEGVRQERERACEHVIAGRMSGDHELAFASIENGDRLTAALQMQHTHRALDRAAQSARNADEVAVGSALNNASTDPEQSETFEEQVADAMLQELRGGLDA